MVALDPGTIELPKLDHGRGRAGRFLPLFTGGKREKAKGGPAVADDCLSHLRRYLELLFDSPATNHHQGVDDHGDQR